MPRSTLRKTLRTRGHQNLISALTAARQKAGMTQRDLASKLKRPRSFVGRLEAGERRIDVIEFIDIARAIGADPRKLLSQLL
jgi:transcriptional regulator with XRE-family HTH domain